MVEGPNARCLEIWADSFKEGEWFLDILARCFHEGERRYRFGFQPVSLYQLDSPGSTLKATVFGDYDAWAPCPRVVLDALSEGKADIIVYDPVSNKILLSVEEMNAVPTGNQSMQRSERVCAAARRHIPCVYLLTKYGVHKDQGIRTSSIWPAYLSLRLTLQYGTPSLTLFFGAEESPENYDTGSGVAQLASVAEAVVRAWAVLERRPELAETLSHICSDSFQFMLKGRRMVKELPGAGHLEDHDFRSWFGSRLLEMLAVPGRDVGKTPEEIVEAFRWPKAGQFVAEGEELYGPDPFLERVEALAGRRRVWKPIEGGTKRAEPRAKVEAWTNEQVGKSRAIAMLKGAPLNMSAEDFPVDGRTGKLIVTTSKTILYLFDSREDFLISFMEAFPQNKNDLGSLLPKRPRVVLYVCNSVESGGRAFKGDPFSGQVAAYNHIFAIDLSARKEALFVAYYPHQLASQLFAADGSPPRAKGVNVIRENVDLVITANGVLLIPKEWKALW